MEKQGNFSIVWKNLCFSDKIREFLFLVNLQLMTVHDAWQY